MILITMVEGCTVIQESLLCNCQLQNVEKYSPMTDFLLADIKQFRLCYEGWENKSKRRPDVNIHYTLGMRHNSGRGEP